ncbi:MAG: aminotransferase class I/II-fold pyridoxal phosphate-dependent enzyme [Phycisphaerales bacterium]|nr:aminotransferase class I/II-fold pyridoxal phosphate-dependent enzyme [Phycisphaerales bacterium]MCB9837514.1 aminotransferase class I/II-fold pyridoxal phosphate-dependent enzyme [Phycisphaera sp.]
MSASNNERYQQSYTPSRPASSTLALHGPVESRRETGPLVPPIVQSTTYIQPALDGYAGPTYSRVDNPTVAELERILGGLESAPPSVTFGSGLAAETALFLATLKAGDHAVVGEAVYGGTTRLFQQLLSELGVDATFVDSTDAQAVRAAIKANTKLVFVESPANPTLSITDIRAVSEIAHEAGALCAVDNTFLTPVLQKPLDLGADISVYSTTKHIEGHSAALGGAVTSRNERLNEKLRWVRKCTGGIIAPFNAWLTLQGLKTLPLRLERQSQNAQVVAEWLSETEGVERVCYPGLNGFTQRTLADAQHETIRGERLHGGVIAFELAGGLEAGKELLRSLELCRLVEHVGSVETLVTHPATMTHADVPRAQRKRFGLTDGLVRLSVGLEDPSDIIADLAKAIEAGLAVSGAVNGPVGEEVVNV